MDRALASLRACHDLIQHISGETIRWHWGQILAIASLVAVAAAASYVNVLSEKYVFMLLANVLILVGRLQALGLRRDTGTTPSVAERLQDLELEVATLRQQSTRLKLATLQADMTERHTGLLQRLDAAVAEAGDVSSHESRG